MKIKYITCDGETEVEDEIISAEFYEEKHWDNGELISRVLCVRPDGDEFDVDFDNIESIIE